MTALAAALLILLPAFPQNRGPQSSSFWPFSGLTIQRVLNLPHPVPSAAISERVQHDLPPVATVSPESLSHTLGLGVARIVIDPGHGGRDEGARGADGLKEKDVALDISLRLARLLRTESVVAVILTRTDDRFVALSSRVATANRARGDLFLSIHANSARSETAFGIETYFLSLAASPASIELAARENAGSNRSLADLKDLVQSIALNDRVTESESLAGKVQRFLAPDRRANRGVKRAPFIVLTGVEMPAVLAEIGFLSNPDDAERLARPMSRESVARALFDGLTQYTQSFEAPCAVSARFSEGQECPSLKTGAQLMAPGVNGYRRHVAQRNTDAAASRPQWTMASQRSTRSGRY